MNTLIFVLGNACALVCAAVWLAPAAYLYFWWRKETDATYQALMKRWADENGFVIVDQKRREAFSPWTFTRSGSQFVYYVTLTRPEERTRVRHAWVRCGGYFLGPKSERVEVRWDGPWRDLPAPEPPPAPPRPQDDVLWDPWVDG